MANISYFKGAESLEDVRVQLIEHLKELDPNSKKFETMIGQYQKSVAKYANKRKSKAGKIYESSKTVAIPPEKFSEMMQKILSMSGIKYYRDGAWFWFKGNTKKHKDELARIGRELVEAKQGKLGYSQNRKEWFFKDYEVA